MDYCKENIYNYWSCCPSINLSNYVTEEELEEKISGITGGCDCDAITTQIEALQGAIVSLGDRITILENKMAQKANESALTPIWDAIYELSGDTPTPTPIEYLTFKAVSDGTFKFSGNSINYSIDNGQTWVSLASNTATPTVTSGNSIKFKADLVANTNGIGTFSSTGQFEVSGNPMSLVNRNNVSVYQFLRLFSGCTGLTSAEHLILNEDVLNDYCYQNMFYGCTSLTDAPTLPALTLENNCYLQMFTYCSALTTAPELPATTLADYSYQGMFYGCTSLNYIKCLATDISGYWATENWVGNVASTGTFVKNKDMNNWTIDSTSGVPIGWTVVDDGVEPTPTSKKLVVTVLNKPNYELDCDSDDYLDSSQTKPDNDYLSYLTAEVGDCITEIGDNAFQYCRNLTAVTLPSTISVIHNYAFATEIYGETTNHLDIYINAVTPPTLDQDNVGTNSFFASDCTIYVPAASVDAYKTAWPTYADKIEAMS